MYLVCYLSCSDYNKHRKKCCKDNSCLFHCNIVDVLGNSLVPNIFTMNKIQQNCTIPNSCNLSCKMNNCISVGFFKSSIVQLLWKYCIKGANDQVEVQTTGPAESVNEAGHWDNMILLSRTKYRIVVLDFNSKRSTAVLLFATRMFICQSVQRHQRRHLSHFR